MAEAKQSKASGRGTGLFDYEMLQSLQAIQGGIKELKNIIKEQEEKGYEEARERLKLNLPKPKAPKLPGLPRIPDMLPSMAGITDFATRLAKYALLGTFLLGLLKETIGKYFDSIEFDSSTLGGLIGGALKDLMTQQPGEDSLLDRFKAAFIKGDAITGALAGAAIGVLGGPVGIVAGAIIGLVGGILYSLLGSDTGDDAKELKRQIDKAVKEATPWAVGGGIIGGIIFRSPAGAIAGAILGTAFYMLRKAMDPTISDNPDAEAKRLTEEAGGKTVFSNLRAASRTFMSNMLGSIQNSVVDAYASVMKMIHKDDPEKLKEIDEQLSALKTKTLTDEEREKEKLLRRELEVAQLAKQRFETKAFAGKYEGMPAVGEIPDELPSLDELGMNYEDQIRGELIDNISRIEKELEDLGKVKGTENVMPLDVVAKEAGNVVTNFVEERFAPEDGYFHTPKEMSRNENRIAEFLRTHPLATRADLLRGNEDIMKAAVEEHGSEHLAIQPNTFATNAMLNRVNTDGAIMGNPNRPPIIMYGDTTTNAIAGSGGGGGTEVVEKEPSFLGFNVNDLNWNYFGRIMSSGR